MDLLGALAGMFVAGSIHQAIMQDIGAQREQLLRVGTCLC